MSLPYDVARCHGANDDGAYLINKPGYLLADCIACLRRTSPGRPEWQSYVAPHAGPGPCPNRIGEQQ